MGGIPRPAVIILVMADDQLLRHSLDPRRIAGKFLHRIDHRSSSPGYLSGMIEIVSKYVTLSALVHSATLPASGKVPSWAESSALPSKETVNRSPSAFSA